METFEAFFNWLHQDFGINLTIGYDAYDRGLFIAGLQMTVKLSVLSIFFSLIIGGIGAAAQGSPSRTLRALVGFFVVFFFATHHRLCSFTSSILQLARFCGSAEKTDCRNQ